MGGHPLHGEGIAHQHVAVVGFGRSGEAAVRALLHAGPPQTLTVVERDDSDDVHARVAALDVGPRLRLHTGEGGLDEVLGASAPDLLVASPGVAPSHPLVTRALAVDVPVWSEVELAWRLNDGRTRLVAVTGTNGKTSTTELLGACLDAPTAGNIGTPLVELLSGVEVPELAVVELSSFQLHFTETLRPDVAVLLNLAADHLDWHGSLDAYGAAKARIWRSQRAEDLTVVSADDPGAQRVLAEHPPPGRLRTFTLADPGPTQSGVRDHRIVVAAPQGGEVELIGVAELGAHGPHNLANALAAATAALAAGADRDDIAAALRRFHPGRHRLQLVEDRGGVRYVDDSKATNPHAAAAALSSFDSVVWIAGGLGKGLDFDELAPALHGRVRVALTIGESGPRIAALTRRLGIETHEVGVLARAVALADQLALPGDTVLLAPACASMDQFADYAERGRAFAEAVAALDDGRRQHVG